LASDGTEQCPLCHKDVAVADYVSHVVGHTSQPFANISDEQARNAGWSHLHRAAGRGSLADVDRELARGADVNAVDRDGWTALFVAAHSDDIDVVARLLDSGARADHNADDGRQAWQFGQDEVGGFLREVLSPHIKDILERGVSHAQLAEVYKRLRSARLAGQPIPEPQRPDFFYAVLREVVTREGLGSPRRTATPPGEPSSEGERLIRDYEVHWGTVSLTTRALWFAQRREPGALIRFDSKVDKVRWPDAMSAKVERREDPDSLMPWTSRHVVVVRVRGSDAITIWCKHEDQAYELAAAIDQLVN
jgi:hypothetical protein